MRLLSRNETELVFELTTVEYELVGFTLRAFPVPHEPPSGSRSPTSGEKSGPDPALLEEILREGKRDLLTRLEQFLETQPPPTPEGIRRLRLARSDVDWFLQVVNDVRVGSWYALGCPEEAEEDGLSINGDNVHHKIRLSVAGQVICRLLDALEGA